MLLKQKQAEPWRAHLNCIFTRWWSPGWWGGWREMEDTLRRSHGEELVMDWRNWVSRITPRFLFSQQDGWECHEPSWDALEQKRVWGENGYECAVRCLRQIPDDPLGQFSEPVRRLTVLAGCPARVLTILLGSLSGMLGHSPVPVTWVSVKQTELRRSDRPRPARRESWPGSLAHRLTKSHHPPLCLSFVRRESWLLRNHVCTRKYTAQLSDPSGRFSHPSNSQKQHLQGFELGRLAAT